MFLNEISALWSMILLQFSYISLYWFPTPFVPAPFRCTSSLQLSVGINIHFISPTIQPNYNSWMTNISPSFLSNINIMLILLIVPLVVGFIFLCLRYSKNLTISRFSSVFYETILFEISFGLILFNLSYLTLNYSAYYFSGQENVWGDLSNVIFSFVMGGYCLLFILAYLTCNYVFGKYRYLFKNNPILLRFSIVFITMTTVPFILLHLFP